VDADEDRCKMNVVRQKKFPGVPGLDAELDSLVLQINQQSGAPKSRVYGAKLAGNVDGTNKTFSPPGKFVPGSVVAYNGSTRYLSSSFFYNGTSITFTTAPAISSVLWCDYDPA